MRAAGLVGVPAGGSWQTGPSGQEAKSRQRQLGREEGTPRSREETTAPSARKPQRRGRSPSSTRCRGEVRAGPGPRGRVEAARQTALRKNRPEHSGACVRPETLALRALPPSEGLLDPLGLAGWGLLNCLPLENPGKGRRTQAQGPGTGPCNRQTIGHATRHGGDHHTEQSGKWAGLGATERTAAETGRSGEEGLGDLHPQPRGRGRPGRDGPSPWRPGEAASRRPRCPRLEAAPTPPSLPWKSPGASPGALGQDAGWREPNRGPSEAHQPQG